MNQFLYRLNTIANDTNKYLKKNFLKKNNQYYLTKPMQYSVFSGGKRFRSAIIVNTGKIFNLSYKKLIIIGAAVECIHSYSLIHDDLPAMDNDNFRRGFPATHKKFNEYTAILAGNALLTLAFEILSSKDLKLSSKIKNELIKTIAIYSGFSGLAGGQYLDLKNENKKISRKKIINIQINKTGKLFAFCCECIAIIQNLSFKKRENLRKLGIDIGLLFQLSDDLIDYKGHKKVVGKSTKKDKARHKPTLVNFIGYKKTLNFANNLKKKINKKIKNYGMKSQELQKSVEFILDRKF